MQHNSSKYLAFALLAMTMLLSGCLSEDTQPQPEQSVKGRVVFAAPEIEVYTAAEITRSSVQTLSDYTGYTYTLTGTSLIDEHAINQSGALATLMSGAPMEMEAGTYRLTVSNESATQTGQGFPTYSGYSDFTLHVDQTLSVTIAMGKPSNTKLTIVLDNDEDDAKDTFAELYESVTFTADGRQINLSDAVAGTVAYYPVGTGTLNYTIQAAAQSGSHVTDISGATGSITVEAGKAYTLTLSANPVTGELIPVVSGTHTGEFD